MAGQGTAAPEQQDVHQEVANKDRTRTVPPSPKDLDQAQLQQLDKLRQRDREVRNHEMAHLAAAGAYALGGPTFEYQKGPDGQRYAVGGHVNIDTSPVPGDPEATLRKAETIRRAALAPGDPSPQDRSVAAAASAMAIKAQIEIQQTGGLDKPAATDANGQNAAKHAGDQRQKAQEAQYLDALSMEKAGGKIDLFG